MHIHIHILLFALLAPFAFTAPALQPRQQGGALGGATGTGGGSSTSSLGGGGGGGSTSSLGGGGGTSSVGSGISQGLNVATEGIGLAEQVYNLIKPFISG